MGMLLRVLMAAGVTALGAYLARFVLHQLIRFVNRRLSHAQEKLAEEEKDLEGAITMCSFCGQVESYDPPCCEEMARRKKRA